MDICSLFHASRDAKATYLEYILEVCASVLYFYFKLRQYYYIEIVPYFIVATPLPNFRVIR